MKTPGEQMTLSKVMQTERPVFTVCMATYNGARHISTQLSSILDEIAPTDELIVVDDHSTDGTHLIAQAILEERPGHRMQLIRLDRNIGHRQAFAKAMSLASSPLVALSDQDDVWIPGRLETLASSIEHSMADLVFGSLTTFGSEPNFVMRNPRVTLHGRLGIYRYIASKCGLHPTLYCFGAACAFRRAAIDANLPIHTEGHEQWLMAQALSTNGTHFTNDVVTARRLHTENLTARRSLNVRASALYRTFIEMNRITGS